MAYYSVVHSLTGELQTCNGEVAMYPSFYSARVERITLNDQTGGYDHFTKVNTRTKHWQVIAAPKPTDIRVVEEDRDTEITTGCYHRSKVKRFFVRSQNLIVPLQRNPEKKKAYRQVQAYERALQSLAVKKVKPRIRKKSQ